MLFLYYFAAKLYIISDTSYFQIVFCCIFQYRTYSMISRKQVKEKE